MINKIYEQSGHSIRIYAVRNFFPDLSDNHVNYNTDVSCERK